MEFSQTIFELRCSEFATVVPVVMDNLVNMFTKVFEKHPRTFESLCTVLGKRSPEHWTPERIWAALCAMHQRGLNDFGLIPTQR